VSRQGIQNFAVVVISIAGASACGFLLYKDIYINKSSSSGFARAGVVAEKQKNVKRKFGDNMVWDFVEKNETLYWDDSIQTGPKSQVQITLRDGNKITLGESSLVVLEHENNQLSLNLKSGQLFVDAIKTGDNSSEIKINGAVVTKKSDQTLSVNIDAVKGEVHATTQGSRQTDSKQILIDNKGQKREVENPVSLVNPAPLQHFYSESDQSVLFKWSAKNAVNTSLEISKDSKFLNLEMSIATNVSSAVAKLAPGEYYWRVKTSAGSKETFSESRSFEVVKMQVPEIVRPANKTTVKYQSSPFLEFSWKEIPSSDYYVFELATDQAFTDLVLKQETTSSSLRTSKLTVGPLYWRVTAAFGPEKRQSAMTSFTLKREIFSPPALQFPDTGFKVSFDFFDKSKGIPFRWKAENEETYRFIFSREKDLSQELLAFETTRTETLVTDNYPVGTYYWSVGHRDEKGDWKYSEIRTLELGPLVPILQPPKIISGNSDEFDLLKDHNLKFSWSKVTGAKEYKFKLMKLKTAGVEVVLEDTTSAQEKDKNDLEDGSYKWFVSSIDHYGRESKPVEHKFKIIHGRPLKAPDFDMSEVQ
jgi:hypothetical protein